MRISLGVLLFCCLLFTSCFDILEEINLRKNGTGEYSIKIDMSDLLKNPMLKGMMEEGDKEGLKDMDSVVYFKNFPDSVIADNPDLWKRVHLKIFSNAEKNIIFTSIHLSFTSLEEIAYMSENIDQVMNRSKGQSPFSDDLLSGSSPSGFLTKGLQYSLKGKLLTRQSDGINTKQEQKENIEMMKGFLGEADYQVTYTLPGKIKKVTIPGATINGKVVTSTVKMMDLMDNKVTLDGTIHFK